MVDHVAAREIYDKPAALAKIFAPLIAVSRLRCPPSICTHIGHNGLVVVCYIWVTGARREVREPRRIVEITCVQINLLLRIADVLPHLRTTTVSTLI